MSIECSLDTIRDSVWEQLQLAVDDRSHGWRAPVLASVDELERPQARIVVLRRVDAERQRLFFFTDRRSPKIHEMRHQQNIALVFWCPQLSWQLRVQARVQIETDGAIVQGAWNSICGTAAASDYLSLEAPGSPMQTIQIQHSTEHALGIVIANVETMDWLHLCSGGHKRALLTATGQQWLVP